MSILTPSRGDLLPIHNPSYGPLQPSAMPAPPPSASPRPPAPFPVSDKIAQSRKAQQGEVDPIQAWRDAMMAARAPNGVRDALAPIEPNNAHVNSVQRPSATASASASASASAVASGSKPHLNSFTAKRSSLAASIPRPAPFPDVFAPRDMTAPATRPTLRDLSVNTPQQVGKRLREYASASTAKRSRVADGAAAVERSRDATQHEWTLKWRKAFPTLVFHFEIGLEDGSARSLKPRLMKMGSRIDQFFSQKITHLIVKNAGSPQKPKIIAPARQLDPRDSPRNPFNDNMGVTDLAQKAKAMGIKVWSVKKLADMLDLLAPVEVSARDSLSTLLEDERLHGTRERDVNAPRPDYYYFKPGSKHLLVEDATGKHRTIMVKEYNSKPGEAAEWPVLFETFLRPSSSSIAPVPIDELKARAEALYVDCRPYKGEQPPTVLRRSTSMQQFPGTPKLPAARPYQNASGNSVVLTSNIASTSTANPSPMMQDGVPALGTGKDRAILQMSKRVQVLKGNARLAASKRLSDEQPLAIARRASMSSTSSQSVQKTFMTQDQVVKMLRQARGPVPDDPNVTAAMRIQNRKNVDAGLKARSQDTGAGYCENCRIKFTDFSAHVVSKKHRKYATNPANFSELDALLVMLQRPPRSWSAPDLLLPCTARHGKVSDCESCNFDYDEHVAQYEAEMEEEEEEEDDQGEEQTSEADGSAEASQEDRVDDLSVDEGEEGESEEGNEVSEDE